MSIKGDIIRWKGSLWIRESLINEGVTFKPIRNPYLDKVKRGSYYQFINKVYKAMREPSLATCTDCDFYSGQEYCDFATVCNNERIIFRYIQDFKESKICPPKEKFKVNECFPGRSFPDSLHFSNLPPGEYSMPFSDLAKHGYPFGKLLPSFKEELYEYMKSNLFSHHTERLKVNPDMLFVGTETGRMRSRTPSDYYEFNHKKSNLKVGDRVQITRLPGNYEGGWALEASSLNANNLIGKVMVIDKDEGEKGFIVREDKYLGLSIYLPYFVLEKVKETPQQLYTKKHKASDLKVGDRVRITRIANSYESGWNCCWASYTMDDLVGKTGKIVNDCGADGFEVAFGEQRYGPKFPYFVLEKVTIKPFNSSWKIHDGEDVCPAEARGKFTLVKLRDGIIAFESDGNSFRWGHNRMGRPADILEYCVIPNPEEL